MHLLPLASIGATPVLPTGATPTVPAIPVPIHTETGDFIISQQGQSSQYNSWLGPSAPKHSKLNWYVL